MVTLVGQNVRPSYVSSFEGMGCMGLKSPSLKIVAYKLKNNKPTVRNNNFRSSLMTSRHLAKSQLVECHLADM
jgi:hypothetical protein